MKKLLLTLLIFSPLVALAAPTYTLVDQLSIKGLTGQTCLGTSATGTVVAGSCSGGAGSVSTSSAITVNQFPYWTGANGTLSGTSTLTYVGGNINVTGTITESGTRLVQSSTLWGLVVGSSSLAHAAVTLAGEDYLTLSGQQITANAIDPDNLAAVDFGDFTCNGTTCSLDSFFGNTYVTAASTLAGQVPYWLTSASSTLSPTSTLTLLPTGANVTGTFTQNGTIISGLVHATATYSGEDYITLSGQAFTGGTISDTHLTSESFGEFTCDSNEDGCTLNDNVTVTGWTLGNFLFTNTTGTTAQITNLFDVSGNRYVTSTHAAVTLAGQDYLTLSGQQITANKLAGDDISLSGEATGTIMYFTGGVWTPFATGTTGQVLKMSGNTITWGADNDTSVATATISTGAATATGPAFIFVTSTASGIWNVTSSAETVRFILPSNLGFFTNDTNYVTSTGANPTASVGLSAVNGSANTFMRSDGAPALSQAIVPTWTGAHIFNGGLTVNSTGTFNSSTIFNAGFSGTSTLLWGGSANVTGTLTYQGSAVSTSTGANPTASVGLSAVNGTANTFLRSDGAPALSQSITPTWTGAHIWNAATTFNATSTFNSSTIISGLTSALVVAGSNGLLAEYAGSSCGGSDQVTGISATGTVSCSGQGAGGNGTVTTSSVVSVNHHPYWTGDGTLSGTSTLTEIVAVGINVTGTLHVSGAVTYDSTLNVTGASTLSSIIIGGATIDKLDGAYLTVDGSNDLNVDSELASSSITLAGSYATTTDGDQYLGPHRSNKLMTIVAIRCGMYSGTSTWDIYKNTTGTFGVGTLIATSTSCNAVSPTTVTSFNTSTLGVGDYLIASTTAIVGAARQPFINFDVRTND